ncbi:hypothetical protein FKM82_020372 [Ascaphus truei]
MCIVASAPGGALCAISNPQKPLINTSIFVVHLHLFQLVPLVFDQPLTVRIYGGLQFVSPVSVSISTEGITMFGIDSIDLFFNFPQFLTGLFDYQYGKVK